MVDEENYLNLRVGDLRLLTWFAWTHANGNPSPLKEVMTETNATKEDARGSRDRLERAFGELFVTGDRGKSMVPNATATNLGASFLLFEKLASLLIREDVDQNALLNVILDLLAQADALAVPVPNAEHD